ncbi:hypothetical protein F5X68DRAFT_48906 [Plectosphaerella plurivora]|uniref:Uncharacterized protein n=1 Tax=Plectosphaerella plurivora TaxID=936078 RepID=A0A9P8VLJ1_9PEZI|nr:hypothetical protein F5X68DRAFT_48906 [Plectosphaerella plurivora]
MAGLMMRRQRWRGVLQVWRAQSYSEKCPPSVETGVGLSQGSGARESWDGGAGSSTCSALDMEGSRSRSLAALGRGQGRGLMIRIRRVALVVGRDALQQHSTARLRAIAVPARQHDYQGPSLTPCYRDLLTWHLTRCIKPLRLLDRHLLTLSIAQHMQKPLGTGGRSRDPCPPGTQSDKDGVGCASAGPVSTHAGQAGMGGCGIWLM